MKPHYSYGEPIEFNEAEDGWLKATFLCYHPFNKDLVVIVDKYDGAFETDKLNIRKLEK